MTLYLLASVSIILLGTTIFFAYRYNDLRKKVLDEEYHTPFEPELVTEIPETTDIPQKEYDTAGLIDKGYEAVEKAEIVRAAMDEVGVGLNKQLAATEESSAALEEMNSAILDLSNRSSDISEQSSMALERTQEGNGTIQGSIEQMRSLNDTVTDSYEVVKSLGTKSREIGSIAKVITDISEQINLLSLNAAIEAARAGEHGKGFAVVADEVRKLAEQTKNSSDQVTRIVDGTKQETEAAVSSMEKGLKESDETSKSMEEVGRLFGEILAATQVIAENNEATSVSTHEMSAGVQQIVAAVEQVTFITQESVEMFDELKEISDDELATMAALVHKVEALQQTSTKDMATPEIPDTDQPAAS
ncbi:UNVERIFIED_CONTAM: methyl-accepting chemotaxis protein [Halobacillus marinus]